MSAKVVSLFAKQEDQKWTQVFARMGMLELLEHMVGFQARRSEAGQIPRTMVSEGLALFRALQVNAETAELRLLAKSYVRFLEQEMGDTG